MKATLPVTDLRKALALLGHTHERRNTIPVLGAVLMEVSPDRVRLTTTNLDTQISVDVEAETDSKGRLAISYRALKGFADAAAGTGTIRHDTATPHLVEMASDDLTLRLRDIYPPEDFPLRADASTDGAVTWEMSQRDAHRMFKLSRHCISNEETRYYLNGVYLSRKPDGETLRVVATDGHRMAAIDTDVEVPEGMSAIVHTDAVDALMAMIDKDGNEPVRFQVGSPEISPRKLQAQIDGVTIETRLIDGTYPDYTRVVPAPSDNYRVTLSRAGVARMYALSKHVSPARGTPLALYPSTNTMKIGTVEGDSITMPAQISVEDDKSDAIGFNVRYLADQARVTPEFRLSTKSPGDPAMVVGEDPDAFWVIMPMRVG